MKKRSGFTLVEILVVLAIIAILAALLFPAFNGARENGRQVNCASNLQQIYLAVNQYHADERRYPDTLLDILGEGAKYADSATPLGTNAPGYFKGGQDSLICKDDDTLSDTPRASYGFLSKKAPTAALPSPITSSFTGDYSQYVWNYLGYRDDGFAYGDEAAANTANGNGACSVATPCLKLRIPTANYNRVQNPVKFSLSNNFAPLTTIITHCVYHRLPTANNLTSPGGLYDATDPAAGAKARDVVLRLDGSVKSLDVSQWKPTDPTQPNLWQIQTN